MNFVKKIWQKYIVVFYYLYSVIIHSILMLATLFSVIFAFMFLPENADLEWTRTNMRELGGFTLLLVLPFISFIFRFFFLAKIPTFDIMLEKKNLLITGILDIVTILALFLLYFIDNSYSLKTENEMDFISGALIFFVFLFFSNLGSIVIFSLIQKFRNWKKTKISKIIFLPIFLILNQFIGVLFLFSIVCMFAWFNWEDLHLKKLLLLSFVFVYAILFQIFDTKLCYYLNLIEKNTILVKGLLFLKSLFFLFIFLCTLYLVE